MLTLLFIRHKNTKFTKCLLAVECSRCTAHKEMAGYWLSRCVAAFSVISYAIPSSADLWRGGMTDLQNM